MGFQVMGEQMSGVTRFVHQHDSGREGEPIGDTTYRFPLYYVNVISYLKIIPSSYFP